MRPILLGTGGSEGTPCAFCCCAVCERARKMRGHEVRSRSSMLLDEESLVDLSPDFFYQSLYGGFDVHRLKNLFITHFHEDHVNVPELESRCSAQSVDSERVNIYCSTGCAHQMQQLFKFYYNYGRPDARDYFADYQLKCVPLWEPFLAGEILVTPVLSSHHGYGVEEPGYNYLFEKNERVMLYAVDTGWYPSVTWEFLRGKKLDIVVMEATYGDRQLAEYAPEHLNIENALSMCERLAKEGCITRDTPVVLTHICHLHSLSHEDTQRLLSCSGYHVLMGYDFMELPIDW